MSKPDPEGEGIVQEAIEYTEYQIVLTDLWGFLH